jgi:hypothetical protein
MIAIVALRKSLDSMLAAVGSYEASSDTVGVFVLAPKVDDRTYYRQSVASTRRHNIDRAQRTNVSF